MRKLLIAVVVLLALVGLVWLVYPKLFYPLRAAGHAVTLAIEQDHLAITGQYPEFGRSNIDADIKALVFDTAVQPNIDSLAEHPHEAGEVETVSVSYDVPYHTLRYRGVVIHVAVKTHDFEGEYVMVRTYDLWKNHVIGLAEIGAPNHDPAPIAAEALIKQLKTQEGVVFMLLGRLGPHNAPLENLLVRPDGLEVYLNPGLVALRERGIITAVIPWADVPGLQSPY